MLQAMRFMPQSVPPILRVLTPEYLLSRMAIFCSEERSLEILETDVQDSGGKTSKYDLSLRFWSDDLGLEPLVAPLGPLQYIHRRGEETRVAGRLRPAPRHFASVAATIVHDPADVDDWLRTDLAALAAQSRLIGYLRTGEVEALFWIAIFGRDPVPVPAVAPDIVRDARALGVGLLIENYTDLATGTPAKTWVVEGAGAAGTR